MKLNKKKWIIIILFSLLAVIIIFPVWNIHIFPEQGEISRTLNDGELNINLILDRFPRYNPNVAGFEDYTRLYLEISWEVRRSLRIEIDKNGATAHLGWVKDCVWYMEDFCLWGKYAGFLCKEVNTGWLKGSSPSPDWNCEKEEAKNRITTLLKECLENNGEYQRWRYNSSSYAHACVCQLDDGRYGYMFTEIHDGVYNPISGHIEGNGSWEELEEYLTSHAVKINGGE